MASIFAGQNTSTASPLGSSAAESPKVAPEYTLEASLAQHTMDEIRRKVSRVKPVPQTQMILLNNHEAPKWGLIFSCVHGQTACFVLYLTIS